MADRSSGGLSLGAEVRPEGGVTFRVWAPHRRGVQVSIEGGRGAGQEIRLEPEGNGYFSGIVEAAGCDSLYRYRLDGGKNCFPDPASRFQPRGPHGPSQVVDPRQFAWSDRDWRGCVQDAQVIYELHVGTFTLEGTWCSAMARLPHLAEVGITVLEVMPVTDFPGNFGWGYDGVNLFAPTRLYGIPDDFRRFVDRAHALGLGVILDVVYNHIGPDGNYLREYSPHYFTDRYKNDWGEAINFDGEESGPVRDYFVANAGYWIDEFHLDGLRLDATHQIFDASPEHILKAVGRRVREMASGRATIVVAESETQEAKLVRPVEQGGCGLDMIWNDDYHHSAMTVLSGHNEAYYSDYRGAPQEFISAAKRGFLFQGQHFSWHKKRRGSPTKGLAPAIFVNFLQNHDQVANSARGLRCREIASPGRHRAMTALTILMPGTPMLFQGDEFGATSPFLFFADHHAELARLVRRGRAEFLSQFPSVAALAVQQQLAAPDDRGTFEQCKLNWAELDGHRVVLDLHRDLIRLRRADPVLRAPRPGSYDGAVLGPEAFLLRFAAADESDRLLIVNLGRDCRLEPAPEPLLAPPENCRWVVRWSSEDPRYGGQGTAPPERENAWWLTGQAALLFEAAPAEMKPTKS